LPLLSGDEYGILFGNVPIAKPFSMANFGGFLDSTEAGFKTDLQCQQTEYCPVPTLHARLDNSIPGKPGT
jgi:hypothetical protein